MILTVEDTKGVEHVIENVFNINHSSKGLNIAVPKEQLILVPYVFKNVGPSNKIVQLVDIVSYKRD